MLSALISFFIIQYLIILGSQHHDLKFLKRLKLQTTKLYLDSKEQSCVILILSSETIPPLEAAQSTPLPPVPPPAVFSPAPPAPETCQASPSSAHRFGAIENDYMDFTEL